MGYWKSLPTTYMMVVLVDLWEDLKDSWSPGNSGLQNSQGILEGDFYSIVAYSRGKLMWVTATEVVGLN